VDQVKDPAATGSRLFKRGHVKGIPLNCFNTGMTCPGPGIQFINISGHSPDSIARFKQRWDQAAPHISGCPGYQDNRVVHDHFSLKEQIFQKNSSGRFILTIKYSASQCPVPFYYRQ
jgi:hypothetical protein